MVEVVSVMLRQVTQQIKKTVLYQKETFIENKILEKKT